MVGVFYRFRGIETTETDENSSRVFTQLLQ